MSLEKKYKKLKKRYYALVAENEALKAPPGPVLVEKPVPAKVVEKKPRKRAVKKAPKRR